MTEREQTCNQDDLLFRLCLNSSYPSPTLFLHILIWTALMSKSRYIEITQVEISLRVAIIRHRWLLSKVAHTCTGRCSHKYIKIELKQHISLAIYTQGRQKRSSKEKQTGYYAKKVCLNCRSLSNDGSPADTSGYFLSHDKYVSWQEENIQFIYSFNAEQLHVIIFSQEKKICRWYITVPT